MPISVVSGSNKYEGQSMIRLGVELTHVGYKRFAMSRRITGERLGLPSTCNSSEKRQTLYGRA